jgi:hypothetical protein
MTAEEIAIRRAVWVAMPDLCLDTDVSLSYAHIARVCAVSPFSLDELDAIFEKEVAPVVGANPLSIAGEWAGFDEEWLASRIVEGPWHFPSVNLAGKDWEAVRKLVAEVRGA